MRKSDHLLLGNHRVLQWHLIQIIVVPPISNPKCVCGWRAYQNLYCYRFLI